MDSTSAKQIILAIGYLNFTKGIMVSASISKQDIPLLVENIPTRWVDLVIARVDSNRIEKFETGMTHKVDD